MKSITKIAALKSRIDTNSDGELVLILRNYGYVSSDIVSRNVKLAAIFGLASQYTFDVDYSESTTAIKILHRAEKLMASRKIFPSLPK